MFKTEKYTCFEKKNAPKAKKGIILFKSIESSTKKLILRRVRKKTKNFLKKKIVHFRVDKGDGLGLEEIDSQKEGRWTLKEHIQLLQALDKFGVNWKKISDIIPSRTSNQIRSHSQKFYKKLKKCKDSELGIDFTSKNINNINDMIAHIKSVNKEYNVINVFLYITEKCFPNRKHKKKDKKNKKNKNIVYENISINNNISGPSFLNDIKANIINKEANINKHVNNNNINNFPVNNFFINNINYYNNINNLALFNPIPSNFTNNTISFQNIGFTPMNILNNYNIPQNLLDKNYIFGYNINNWK